ncbi:MAG: GNAT family N-acetyltransferase [Bacteroidota bacterium]
MNITFHKATVTDTETLVTCRIQFALELTGPQDKDNILNLRAQLTSYFDKATKDNSCISFIAKANGSIAGIGSVHVREMPGNLKNPSGKWGYIMNMYTLPAYRRNGICAIILNLLVEEGKKYGIGAFELHATKEGEFVYLQNGFSHHHEPNLRKYITL